MKITIITPTYMRNEEILNRCLASVNGQTYTDWEHIVIVDDATLEGHVSQQTLDRFADSRRRVVPLGYNSKNWANTPRQRGIERATGDYLVFLDDDNVFFPDALEQYVRYFEDHPDIHMAICKILHCGPLAAYHGPPPKILDGKPPTLQNVDTLQVCVWAPVAKRHGWLDKGYMSDGYTIELWASQCSYAHLEKILGCHL